jgi:hypothetical protein
MNISDVISCLAEKLIEEGDIPVKYLDTRLGPVAIRRAGIEYVEVGRPNDPTRCLVLTR